MPAPIEEQSVGLIQEGGGMPNGGSDVAVVRNCAATHHAVRAAVFTMMALLMANVPAASAGESAGKAGGASGISSTLVRPAHASVQNFNPPYPFTSDQLWKKMLKIVAMPDGHVTLKQVDHIFGAKLSLYEQGPGPFGHYRNRYGVLGHRQWYFDLLVDDVASGDSIFYFGWGFPPDVILSNFGLPPPGMCIRKQEVMASLAANGWTLAGRTKYYESPDPYQYGKGKKAFMQVGFTNLTECLFYLEVSSNKDIAY